MTIRSFFNGLRRPLLFRLLLTTAGVLFALALSMVLALAQAMLLPQRGGSADEAPAKRAAAAETTTPFRDAQGRYRMSVPEGWEESPGTKDPVFRHGENWVEVDVLNAGSAADAVDKAESIVKPRFSAIHVINRGATTIGGHTAHGLNLDAVTGDGRHMSVLLTAQSAGDKKFVVLLSATTLAEATRLNSSIMTMANSVRFNGE